MSPSPPPSSRPERSAPDREDPDASDGVADSTDGVADSTDGVADSTDGVADDAGTAAVRRRRLAEVFGDVLPEQTRDDRSAPGGRDDSWYLENRPPHH